MIHEMETDGLVNSFLHFSFSINFEAEQTDTRKGYDKLSLLQSRDHSKGSYVHIYHKWMLTTQNSSKQEKVSSRLFYFCQPHHSLVELQEHSHEKQYKSINFAYNVTYARPIQLHNDDVLLYALILGGMSIRTCIDTNYLSFERICQFKYPHLCFFSSICLEKIYLKCVKLN